MKNSSYSKSGHIRVVGEKTNTTFSFKSTYAFMAGELINSREQIFSYENYPNALEQFFGIGSIQNSQQLIINKSSLIGLTPQLKNTAESLLIALILTILKYNSTTNSDSLITVKHWKTELLESSIISNILLINFYTPAKYINYSIVNANKVLSPKDFE